MHIILKQELSYAFYFAVANFLAVVYLDLDTEKILHDNQMNYIISSDKHNRIIALS